MEDLELYKENLYRPFYYPQSVFDDYFVIDQDNNKIVRYKDRLFLTSKSLGKNVAVLINGLEPWDITRGLESISHLATMKLTIEQINNIYKLPF